MTTEIRFKCILLRLPQLVEREIWILNGLRDVEALVVWYFSMQFIFLESAKGKFCVVWGSCQSVCREFNLKLYACLTNQGDDASLFPSFSFMVRQSSVNCTFCGGIYLRFGLMFLCFCFFEPWTNLYIDVTFWWPIY